jgi:hypothetical protein
MSGVSGRIVPDADWLADDVAGSAVSEAHVELGMAASTS